MYCSNCGQPNEDNFNYCASCGAQLRTPEGSRNVSQMEDDLAYVLPIGTPIIAFVAGYFGLFSLLIAPAPIAIILGIVGLAVIRKREKKRGRIRCWFAIIMGTLCTALPVAGMLL